MSTLKVVNVQHPSASEPSITLDSDGGMTGGFPSPNRNLVYNGAMQVAQRGTSTTGITTAGYYTVDRYLFEPASMGTWTMSVENDAPTGSGFGKSTKILCTTADASPAASDNLNLQTRIEGQDLQRVAKGTPSAQQLTLSFWVKSNVTGTYIAELYDGDNSRQVSASYTVSASATWERKVITFPADTTGAFDNDNGLSLYLVWHLGSGSNLTSGTLNTVWATPISANRAVGQTNLAAATDNYWQITGVQLEVGPAATPFEFKSFGQELRECQRYYYQHLKGTGPVGIGLMQNSATGLFYFNFPVTMRAVPSLISETGTNYYQFYRAGAAYNFNSFYLNQATTNTAELANATLSGTAGDAGQTSGRNALSSIALSAEL